MAGHTAAVSETRKRRPAAEGVAAMVTEKPLFTTEVQYRAALEAWHHFGVTVSRLKQVPRISRPTFAENREEKRLFDRLIGDVLPTLRRTIELPEPMDALSTAIRSVTDWRQAHLDHAIDDQVWPPVVVPSQTIGNELRRWSQVYPAAYRDVYLHEK
jgi:hypothetical protein